MIKQNSISQVRGLGIEVDDAWALRRISMTLHRWYEHECNGAIQRDGDRGDGLPFWHSTYDGRKLCRAPDRERGALKRLAEIMARYPDLTPYVQGDPRGCALYILRPNDVPEGKDADAYYSRGIPVY
jgi:hypothetical protein